MTRVCSGGGSRSSVRRWPGRTLAPGVASGGGFQATPGAGRWVRDAPTGRPAARPNRSTTEFASGFRESSLRFVISFCGHLAEVRPVRADRDCRRPSGHPCTMDDPTRLKGHRQARAAVRVRHERRGDAADVAAVRAVCIAAFPSDAEARLLDALRAAGDCDPARSLVAELDGTVLGQCLLTAMILELSLIHISEPTR